MERKTVLITTLLSIVSLLITGCGSSSRLSSASDDSKTTQNSGIGNNSTITTPAQDPANVTRTQSTQPANANQYGNYIGGYGTNQYIGFGYPQGYSNVPSPAQPDTTPFPIDIRFGSAHPCTSHFFQKVDSWALSVVWIDQPGFGAGLSNPSIDQPVLGFQTRPANGCSLNGVALPCINQIVAMAQSSPQRAQGMRMYFHRNDRMLIQGGVSINGSWVYFNGTTSGGIVSVADIYNQGVVLIPIGSRHVIELRPSTNTESLVCPQ